VGCSESGLVRSGFSSELSNFVFGGFLAEGSNMAITLEDEKRFVILLSIEDLRGSGTKKQILDNIDQQGYLALNRYDLSQKLNRPELVWRNDLAFIRKHLVTEGYLDGGQRDQWKITSSGSVYMQNLRLQISKNHQRSFQKLTQKAINRIERLVEQGRLRELEIIVSADIEALDIEEERFEGTQRERYTNYYERDAKLRAEAISIHGTKCMVCGFDFEERYGERGKGFIEVHHLTPVSELGSNTKVNSTIDLAVVCSNCHRMIHRQKDNILSLGELKKLIKTQ